MYAIIEVAGKQFRVSKGDSIRVPVVAGEAGKDVNFDKVLLIADKGKFEIGQPALKGATVKAKLESFGRERKILVFKKKRRKGYRVTNGHRQGYAEVTIKSIAQAKAKKSGDSDGA